MHTTLSLITLYARAARLVDVACAFVAAHAAMLALVAFLASLVMLGWTIVVDERTRVAAREHNRRMYRERAQRVALCAGW